MDVTRVELNSSARSVVIGDSSLTCSTSTDTDLVPGIFDPAMMADRLAEL